MFARRNVRKLSFKRLRPTAAFKARARSVTFRAKSNYQLGAPMGRPGTEEIKCFDTVLGTDNTSIALISAATTNEPAAWAAGSGLTCLNEIPIGTDFFNRVGAKSVVKSVQIKFNIVATNNTVPGSLTTVRYCLIYDRQPNGAYPAIPAILSEANAAALTLFDSGVNMTNRSRFQMIRDQFTTLDPAAGQLKHIDMFAQGRWDVEFGGNNNLITDIKSGSLLFMIFAVDDTAGPVLGQFQSRIRYWD